MIDKVIDYIVHVAAPADKESYSSVRQWVIWLMLLPMLLLTDLDSPLQVRTTITLFFNVYVRLTYPSCYFPASASVEGYIASPLTARLIAFVAEFSLYELWAEWVDVPFWGASNIWAVVLFGECVSTASVLLQTELGLNVEDSTWCLHTIYMAYLSYPKYPWAVTFFSLFGLHFVLYHLPRRFKLMFDRIKRGGKSAANLFKLDPLYLREWFSPVRLKDPRLHKVRLIKKCGEEEKAWVVPMLFGQSILTAIMYYQINLTDNNPVWYPSHAASFAAGALFCIYTRLFIKW